MYGITYGKMRDSTRGLSPATAPAVQKVQARQRHRSWRGRGFSLLEAMLAMALFMIGMAALLSMQVASIRSGQASTEISLATNIASATVEDLKVRDFDSVTSTTTRYFGKNGAEVTRGDAYFTVNQAITEYVDEFYKDAQVSVQWRLDASETERHQVKLRARLYSR